MKRTKPMKRSGFARPVRRDLAEAYVDAVVTGTGVYQVERPRLVAALLRPAVMAHIDDVVRAVPKEVPLRSEAYRRLVAQLPCRICGAVGRSQAAHPNTGKGQGSKTDDRLCFPLCADAPGVRGCHALFDQAALYDKTTRRLLEQAWGSDTRQRIELLGWWPEEVPRWPAETTEPDRNDEEPTP